MPAADRLLPKAGLLWDGPGAAYDAQGSTKPGGDTVSCTWCWPGTIEPTNVVFAALTESSLPGTAPAGRSALVRAAAGTAPSRTAPEPISAPPKIQPLPTFTTC